MEKIAFKYVASSVEGDDEALSKLVEELGRAGIFASVGALNSGHSITIYIPDSFKQRSTRNAGAKRKPLPKGSPLRGMSDEEALMWCRNEGAKAAAKALGISVSTAYYRIRSGRIF